MKGFVIGIALLSLVGCGKTLSELKVNADATIDNTAGTANEVVYTVGRIVKKILGIVPATYEVGKKVVEDSKDNTATVVNTVTGASETPVAP